MTLLCSLLQCKPSICCQACLCIGSCLLCQCDLRLWLKRIESKESLKMKKNEKEYPKSVKSLLASLNIQALANSVTNGNSQIHVLGKAKMRPTTYKQRILLTLRSCSKKDLQNLDNLNDCNTRHVISCYDSVIRNILSEMATYNQECLNWAVHCILLRLQSFCWIWPHKESQCILWLRLTTFCGT